MLYIHVVSYGSDIHKKTVVACVIPPKKKKYVHSPQMTLLKRGSEAVSCKLNTVLTFREWLDNFAIEKTK